VGSSWSGSLGAGSAWWTTHRWGLVVRRAAYTFAAAVLADLIVGLGVFSIAILSILCYFSVSWIGLVQAYSSIGQGFGTEVQLRDAFAVLGVSPALMIVVGFLSIRAFRLPKMLWNLGRTGQSRSPQEARTRPKSRPAWARRIDWRPGGSESEGLGSALFALSRIRNNP
jgi:hypothetical protein